MFKRLLRKLIGYFTKRNEEYHNLLMQYRDEYNLPEDNIIIELQLNKNHE